MTNDVAVFLDLDNLVIGAKQVNLTFDIHLILEHIKKLTEGRVVLRQAYGAGRQSQDVMKQLAQAGFTVQSATRINNYGKNLADMQIVVNAMDTLIDGHKYETYVLMSGDRDFTPLVQSLRKRGKCVIGVGIRHTTSSSLVELCDQYIYYEDLAGQEALTADEIESLLIAARDELLQGKKKVRASLLKQRMMEQSSGRFANTDAAQGSFTQFLQRYPQIIHLRQEGTTTYVSRPLPASTERPLYLRYRTALKQRRLRVVPAPKRLAVLRALINVLAEKHNLLWRDALAELAQTFQQAEGPDISKNKINAVMLLARQAEVIRTRRGRSLSTAPVFLAINGDKIFQQAVLQCDRAYLDAISTLPEPFDLSQAALALYDSEDYLPYVQRLVQSANAGK